MDEYLYLLKETFLVNEEIDKFNGNYIKKENLLRGYIEAEKNLENWEVFIKALRQQNKVRVRDMKEAVDPYSFVGNLSYKNASEGIVFAINFAVGLYGFYFAKYTEIENAGTYIEEFSYAPFDEEMENQRNFVESTLNEYFVGYKPFDNAFAEIKVERIVLGRRIYKDLDLWKALISNNNDGLV
jgi:hypothetical protein